MTRQESFKQRVRARMADTGERYAAARRALVAASEQGARRWASPPETGDDAVRKATGRGWNEWCDLIDAWPQVDDADHTAIARHLHTEIGLGSWWAQTITVGYERITGRRVPHQRADGSFAVSRSRTVAGDREELRALIDDDQARQSLFPAHPTRIVSRPGTVAQRIAFEDGIARVSIAEKDDGRITVSVEHAGLRSSDDAERWRHWWGEWLDAIDLDPGDRDAGGP